MNATFFALAFLAALNPNLFAVRPAAHATHDEKAQQQLGGGILALNLTMAWTRGRRGGGWPMRPRTEPRGWRRPRTRLR